MAVRKAPSFDPLSFLSRVDGGRTITEYHKNEWIYRQGESAGAVFYLQQGKAKVSVVSEQGKEAVVGFLSTGTSSAKEPWADSSCASLPWLR